MTNVLACVAIWINTQLLLLIRWPDFYLVQLAVCAAIGTIAARLIGPVNLVGAVVTVIALNFIQLYVATSYTHGWPLSFSSSTIFFVLNPAFLIPVIAGAILLRLSALKSLDLWLSLVGKSGRIPIALIYLGALIAFLPRILALVSKNGQVFYSEGMGKIMAWGWMGTIPIGALLSGVGAIALFVVAARVRLPNPSLKQDAPTSGAPVS